MSFEVIKNFGDCGKFFILSLHFVSQGHLPPEYENYVIDKAQSKQTPLFQVSVDYYHDIVVFL